MQKLTEAKLKELRELLDEIAHAGTKASAMPLIRKLEFQASMLSSIDPYFKGKLREAISHAKDAAGQVRDKDFQIMHMNNSWYVFYHGVCDQHS